MSAVKLPALESTRPSVTIRARAGLGSFGWRLAVVVHARHFGVQPPVGRLERILGTAGYELAVAHVDAVSVMVGVEPSGEGGGAVEQCHIQHRGSFPNGRAPYSAYGIGLAGTFLTKSSIRRRPLEYGLSNGWKEVMEDATSTF